MRTVWAYKLKFAETLVLLVPKGAVFLSVQVHHGGPTVWFEVEDSLPKERRKFRLVTDREKLPDDEVLSFKGTFQKDEGNMIFHLFEIILSGKRKKVDTEKVSTEKGMK